jgi:chitosanase
MARVVEYYGRLAPGNPLTAYLPALHRQEIRGIGRTTKAGLGRPFVRAWKAAAADPRFRQAQDHAVDAEYFRPAVDRAIADGLHALGQFIYYDAMVMHGHGNDPEGFGGIRTAAMRKARTPARGGDETTYLNAFLDARKAAMLAELGHSDTTRVDDMQRRFLRDGNLDLRLPLSWSTYGDRYSLRAR